jgi:hypothetical protein
MIKYMRVTHNTGKEVQDISKDDVRVPQVSFGEVGFLTANKALPIKLELAILFERGRGCAGNEVLVELVDGCFLGLILVARKRFPLV